MKKHQSEETMTTIVEPSLEIEADGRVMFSIRDHATGAGEEEVSAQWSGEASTYRINAKGILRVLSQIETESVLMRFPEPDTKNGSILLNERSVNGDRSNNRLFLTMMVAV